MMMIAGIVIVLFSAFFVVSAVADLVGGESETEMSVLAGLLVFFFLTGIGGLYMAVNSRKRAKKRAEERMEREILGLIAAKGGQITPFEVAAETDLSAAEAQAYLDKLCSDGMGTLKVTPEGDLVYVFRGAAAGP
jgi:uncharacterized membrane protein